MRVLLTVVVILLLARQCGRLDKFPEGVISDDNKEQWVRV